MTSIPGCLHSIPFLFKDLTVVKLFSTWEAAAVWENGCRLLLPGPSRRIFAVLVPPTRSLFAGYDVYKYACNEIESLLRNNSLTYKFDSSLIEG